jgi:hypothetical protein
LIRLKKGISFKAGQAQSQRHFGGMAPACAWEKLLTTSIAIGESNAQSQQCDPGTNWYLFL